jgi:hypothetical protein
VTRVRALVPRLVLALLAGGLPAAAAEGQDGLSIIKGVVKVNRTGLPIEGARVVLVGTAFAVATDVRGEFEFPALVPGRYVVRATAIGYVTVSSPVELRSRQTMDLEFLTEAEAARLPDVTVEERAEHGPVDWLRRKEEGRGRYITRADLERRRAATLPDALRLVPGVRVECLGNQRCYIRLTRAPRGCNPAFFMDGIPSDPAIAWLTPVHEVEGIEIYSGPADTPPELESQQARCGVVVVWTRTPPPRQPRQPRLKPPVYDSLRIPPPDTVGLRR